MKFRHVFLVAVVVLSLGATFVASASAKPVSGKPAASFYTPAALNAWSLRMQAMARTYNTPSVGKSSDGFDVRDGLIGAAGGLGVAISAAGLIALTRSRRPQVAL